MSVKHLRFLKKALYKYKIISIKVGLFVLVGFKCVFSFLPEVHLQIKSTHFGNCLTAFAQKLLLLLSKEIFPGQHSMLYFSFGNSTVFPKSPSLNIYI